MKTSTFAIAIAAFGLSAAPAYAGCAPAPTITDGDTLTLNAQDCHLVIDNPAVLPLSPTTEFIIRDPGTGEIGSDNGAVAGIVIGAYNSLDGRLDTVEGTLAGKANVGDSYTKTEADGLLDGKADKTAVETANAAQNIEIGKKADKDYVDSENVKQDNVINQNKTDIATNKGEIVRVETESKKRDAVQDGDISNLQGDNKDQWSAINAHTALLSEHSATLADHGKRLDAQEKGLAIAMAMPDAWLSDKQSFAIAGGLGGFGDETAIAFSAIGRIDETWSLNAGFGGDTEFKEFGWKVGARAGW